MSQMSHAPVKATAGCLVSVGRTLLMVRETQAGQQNWDIPAGGVELGETPEQAIVREVLEETGLQLPAVPVLQGIYWMSESERTTVHFLYRIELSEDFITQVELRSQDADIDEIAFQPEEFIREIIGSGSYEHDLAKARLEAFLNGQGEPNAAFVVV